LWMVYQHYLRVTFSPQQRTRLKNLAYWSYRNTARLFAWWGRPPSSRTYPSSFRPMPAWPSSRSTLNCVRRFRFSFRRLRSRVPRPESKRQTFPSPHCGRRRSPSVRFGSAL
jgi:hypothetical protein